MDVKDFASLGGKARWNGKTKKQRREHAKLMLAARKKKKGVG